MKIATKLENTNKALLAFQKEFTQYQVDNDKRTRDDITTREIRFDRIAKSIQKNEDTIYGVNKKLPENIMRIVSQIEFGKPLNKKTNI